MSKEYDLYLEQHRANVAKGFYWIQENLPELLIDIPNVSYEHQICYSHDNSKDDSAEYKAYDAYFYGRNRSFQVVQDFQYAWLTHIHKNPHHWQHWILVHDDIKNGKLETILEIPYNYIIEMICDWWAFSWARSNLYEIFNWYDEHSKNMKLAPETRTTVESILNKIKNTLDNSGIIHSGVKGMKWGVKNGPPYPIKYNGRVAAIQKRDRIVENAIKSGEVIKTINRDKQERHNKTQHIPGRSYLNGDTEYAQKLVNKYSGTGESKLDHHGKWNHRERIFADEDIGMYVDDQGTEIPSNVGMIVYSNTGTHIYPARRKENK
jgi:hypothetical protein